MKSWYVQYGCELGGEHCVVLCEEEERVKEWAIDQSHFYYSGYNHGEFEDEFEDDFFEDEEVVEFEPEEEETTEE